jgi:ArpU family phage transcriptional regulator
MSETGKRTVIPGIWCFGTSRGTHGWMERQPYTRVITAEQERDRIRRTAESLKDPYRSILLLKFCQRDKWLDWQIYERLGYGKARFYELQNEAFLMFAEIYDGGRLLVYEE